MSFATTISVTGYALESFGVLIIVIGALTSTLIFLRNVRRQSPGQAYHGWRQQIGRAIILGLEFLIAGDIVRTVIVDESLHHIAMLVLIILIREVLSLTLYREVEGRWPWQGSDKVSSGDATSAATGGRPR